MVFEALHAAHERIREQDAEIAQLRPDLRAWLVNIPDSLGFPRIPGSDPPGPGMAVAEVDRTNHFLAAWALESFACWKLSQHDGYAKCASYPLIPSGSSISSKAASRRSNRNSSTLGQRSVLPWHWSRHVSTNFNKVNFDGTWTSFENLRPSLRNPRFREPRMHRFASHQIHQLDIIGLYIGLYIGFHGIRELAGLQTALTQSFDWVIYIVCCVLENLLCCLHIERVSGNVSFPPCDLRLSLALSAAVKVFSTCRGASQGLHWNATFLGRPHHTCLPLLLHTTACLSFENGKNLLTSGFLGMSPVSTLAISKSIAPQL